MFKAISSETETDMIFVICKECYRKLHVFTFHKKSLFSVVDAKIDALAEKFENISNMDKKFDDNIMKKAIRSY